MRIEEDMKKETTIEDRDQQEMCSEATNTETSGAEQATEELIADELDSVDRVTEELEQLKDDYLRLRAEYDNFRKRTLKEKSDLLKYAGEKTLIAFLGVMDDFELALKNIEHAEDVASLAEGVRIIQNKFIATLKSQGVNAMDVIGKPFNPDEYEAISMMPVEDPKQKGMVVDCLQTGYTLNDKVIRHPKVVVGQ